MKKSRKILFLILGFAVLFLVLAWYTTYNRAYCSHNCTEEVCPTVYSSCSGEIDYSLPLNLLIFDGVIWVVFLIWYFYSRKLTW